MVQKVIKKWDDWINSNARLSPKTRNVKNLDEKIKRLKNFENWEKPRIIKDFETLVGETLWKKHNENLIEIQEKMKEYQIIADEIKKILKENIV